MRKASEAWSRCYYGILENVKAKYPNMSKEGQVMRAYKTTNMVFRKKRRSKV